jgi:nitrite reductase/ring-hydroxylating ferredoxin subunit
MTSDAYPPAPPARRRLLAIFVNDALALVAGGLATLLGLFAARPGGVGAAAPRGRWIRAGTLSDLRPGIPAARVLAISRTDGWYRERARETVFVILDEEGQVRGLSATCTHLGCRVHWDDADATFRCPCHGGTFDASGRVLAGPPPRPLDPIDARVDPDGTVMVRV